ncbi:hypothetical protein llap_14106 [Limosa lapponica baueri]|uniref:Uncharacterized protein n=1 Tax=Limosa lapponica baueri TaxID=1758121 RepID=A0A2I0TP86_LIMLA|nr:hypothetical protein llap_14106 [Limosa lapponica baueri]
MISLTFPTATVKGRAETETDAVKLDLAERFRQDQKGTAETGNKKKLLSPVACLADAFKGCLHSTKCNKLKTITSIGPLIAAPLELAGISKWLEDAYAVSLRILRFNVVLKSKKPQEIEGLSEQIFRMSEDNTFLKDV